MPQQIIDGKRYDTDPATEVYEWSNGKNSGDFDQETKTLYRTPGDAPFPGLITPGGAWFIVTIRGVDGPRIYPQCEDLAFEFLEEHSADPEAFHAAEEYFADRITDA